MKLYFRQPMLTGKNSATLQQKALLPGLLFLLLPVAR